MKLTPDTAVLTEHQRQRRQAAYQLEADPLFFQWQAGERSKEDWLQQREAIRMRFPYPSGEE